MDTDAHVEDGGRGRRGWLSARIGVPRPVCSDVGALRAPHRGYLLTVPFGELSVHLGGDIVLAADRLTTKVWEGRCGGHCLELNGALAALLRALGLGVTLLQGRVNHEEGQLGTAFDHVVLRTRRMSS